MKTKCIQTGNMIEFLHPTTRVSKSSDQWC